jgi:diketogulonate reductase-like aldo/keto reductase
MWWRTSNEADFKPENVDVVEVGMSETWEGMEEIKELGLAKHIGVSNHAGGLLLDVYKSAKKYKVCALLACHVFPLRHS